MLKSILTKPLESSSRMMLLVAIALLPGLTSTIYYFGFGILVNVCISALTCLSLEALILNMRAKPLTPLMDGSALVTGLLIGLILPPDLSPGIVIFGAAFGIVFGKLLYGGLGQNPFNPAMVGYAALIISFPLAMSTWPSLMTGNLATDNLATDIDAISAATPLDLVKFRGAETIDELYTGQQGFLSALEAWQVINLGYLLGGLYLVYLRVAKWQGALSFLLTMLVLYALNYDGGSSISLGSPLFQLFSGGTMLAAFFIITDPVTSPDSNKGLILFGIGVGVLTFGIRSYGAYPDGIAFAVLLMNAVSPLIDQIRLRAK